MRILIYEDAGCADLAPTALCAAQGHDVVGIARTVHQAIHLVRSANPDIALLLSLEDGSDEVFLLMHNLSKSGVPSILISCDAVQGGRASMRCNEAELAAALARYQRKLNSKDDGEE